MVLCQDQFPFRLLLVVSSFGLVEAFFACADVLRDKHGIKAVVMDDLWRMAVYLVDLCIIQADSVHYRDDFTSRFVEFFKVRHFLDQLGPELLVELSGMDHCFFTERNVVIESNDFDEVAFFLFALL